MHAQWWTTPLPMHQTTWAPTLWGLWSITHPSPWPTCCQCVNPLFHPMLYPLGPRLDRPRSREAPSLSTPNPEFSHQQLARSPWVRPKNPQLARDRSPLPQRTGFGWFGTEQPRDKLGGAGPRTRSSPEFGRAEEGRAIEAARVAARDVVRVFSAKARSWGCSSANTAASCSWTTSCTPSTWAATVTETPLDVQHLRPLQQDRYEFSSHIVPRRTHLSLRIPRTLAVS